MNYWLLKSEPESWSWDDQVARAATGEMWDGVRSHQAASFLREMAVGDQAFFYHSGRERRIVGIVKITEAHFADPTDSTGRFVAVRVQAVEPLPEPVTLAAIKAEPALADMLLVRQSRLSVMPVSAAQWRRICALGKG